MKKFGFFIFCCVLFLATLLCAPVWAACSSPSGSLGQVVYNADYHVMEYCDGSNWIEMGHSANSGTSNCAGPTGSPGEMFYNSDYNVMQYCNGADWVSMGTVPFASDNLGLNYYWKLDESAGTTAYDTFGGSDGTLVNGPVWESAAGYIGGALHFDGTDDYVNIPYNASMVPAGGFTLSFWANPDVLEAAAFIRGAGGNGWSESYRIVMTSSTGSVGSNCYDGSTHYGPSMGRMTVGQWDNIMFTYDGSSVQLYFDGAPGPIESATCLFGTSGDMQLGVSSGVEELDGYMDDVRLFDNPLTADEINNLFMDMVGPISDVTSGLIGHWKFDDGSGSIATDSSGNGFDGTLVNGPTWSSTGIIKGSLTFTDSNMTYVDIPYNATLAPTSGITYSAWVYPTINNSYKRVIHRGRDSHDLRLMPDGTATFNLNVNGTTYSPNTGASLYTNGWHQLVGTYDGSEVAIYLDGVKRDAVAATGSITAYTNDVIIGWDPCCAHSGEAFNGNIDDVRMYNRALSASEVRQLYFYREHRPSFTPTTCSNPTGNPGDMVYNSSYSVMQYCNGAEWVGIGK